jgi:hypothetical protein
MRHSDVVVAGSRGALRAALMTVAKVCLTLAISCTGVVVAPSAVFAAGRPTEATSSVATPRNGPASQPSICRPEPPDYPGCTPEQVRPLLQSLFGTEYTGHAYGYRYYRMGQHPRGLIFAHLLPALNAKLARLYRAAVARYEATHTSVTVDGEGVRHEVVSYPRYRTWVGFRDNTTAFCTANNVTIHFPTQYCWSITKLGQAGAAIDALLNKTLRIVFSCDGFAIGGLASGGFTGWRMGTGLLEGGYYGGAAVEIGCQTTHLWNCVTSLW